TPIRVARGGASGWSAPETVARSASASFEFPLMVIDAAGRITLVWSQFGPGGPRLLSAGGTTSTVRLDTIRVTHARASTDRRAVWGGGGRRGVREGGGAGGSRAGGGGGGGGARGAGRGPRRCLPGGRACGAALRAVAHGRDPPARVAAVRAEPDLVQRPVPR